VTRRPKRPRQGEIEPPAVTVLRVTSVDEHGEARAVPERLSADSPGPDIRVIERGRRGGALAPGDRFLGRTEARGSGHVAFVMKKLLAADEMMLGVVHREGQAHWLRPVEKKERRELPISDLGGAEAGDLVLAEKSGRPPRLTARVTQILGDPFAPRAFSLIAIHKHGIPDAFPSAVLDEAKAAAGRALGEREDLTHLPIVAIDPADARDHDDAVWAAPDDHPANPGGWKAIVAIADVAFYVRPGSALDREARKRGNSVYFPDRVVPMLPEELSAGICSLKSGEDRAALACHLVIAKDGRLKSWRFTRARLRLAANIAYEDAQAAIDGRPLEKEFPKALVDSALRPLWACWAALKAARDAREPLELDLPERRVVLDEKGRILSVAPRERLDAHKLIEDYMIAANVAAAKALESKKAPVMYRDHEPPGREKLLALKEYLATFGIEFALGQVIRPATFNRLIERARAMGEAEIGEIQPQVMEQVLRTQTQAYYAPANQGHFGLALGSYAHFTSPIRRYADLLVHRSLVRAFGLGPDGLTTRESQAMEVTGELISQLERRAMEAERDTIDRYVAAFLAERVGELVDCRITGVQPFGFFATVEGLGGDGIVLAATLGDEYFRHDEARMALVGDRSGTGFILGQRLKLRLAEANPVSGGLRFELPEGGSRQGKGQGRGQRRGIQRRRQR